MAVVFPTPFGYTLNPRNQAEMIQGFLNIEAAQGVTSGKLTKADVANYAQKQFFAADPNSAVASYFNNNFDVLAEIGNHDNTLSVDDLVRLHNSLPEIPNVANPPIGTLPNGTQPTTGYTPIFIPVPVQNGNTGNAYGQPAYGNNANAKDMTQMITLILSQMMQMLKSIF